MDKNDNQKLEKKLNSIVELLQNLLALELFKSGATQDVIARRLRIAKASVVAMLKGVKKEK